MITCHTMFKVIHGRSGRSRFGAKEGHKEICGAGNYVEVERQRLGFGYHKTRKAQGHLKLEKAKKVSPLETLEMALSTLDLGLQASRN